MRPPSSGEVGNYLTGIARMAFGDAEGLKFLDLTTRGFWRSFWAFAYSLPAYCVVWIADRNSLLTAQPETQAGFGYLVSSATTDVAGIALALLAVALLARPLRMSNRFAQWVIVGNWLSLPIAYVMAPINWLAVGIPGAEGIAAALTILAIVGVLVISVRVYRVALGGDGMLAFGLLVISELIYIMTKLSLG